MSDNAFPIGQPFPGEPKDVSKGRLSDLINRYADARVLREMAEDDLRKTREVEDKLEAELFEALEQQNLKSVRHERGLFLLNDLAWATILDAAAVREWAENEDPSILLPNATKLAVVVRQALAGERPMPPGVEARFSRKIGWRRS